MILNGYDFSHWQTDAQIRAVMAGCDFVFHKATEGTTYRDKELNKRCQWLFKDRPGFVYHYLRADRPNVEGEVVNFVTMVNYVEDVIDDKIGVAIDVEYSSKTGGTKNTDFEYFKRFCEELRKRCNKRLIVYMPDLYSSAWYNWIREMDYGLWIARYRSKRPEHACDFWQYTNSPLDKDYFFGDYEKLESFVS